MSDQEWSIDADPGLKTLTPSVPEYASGELGPWRFNIDPQIDRYDVDLYYTYPGYEGTENAYLIESVFDEGRCRTHEDALRLIFGTLKSSLRDQIRAIEEFERSLGID